MTINMPSQLELLQGAQALDSIALAQIYDTYSPGLYRYAMRLLGDQQLAEDCVAETFSRFLQAIQSGGGPLNFLQAYLYRVAHNWITDNFRHSPLATQELDEELGDEQESPEEVTNRRLRQNRVRSALGSLTPDQQQVIVLKYLEGWENDEIARVLKKPVGAIKSLQHRALAALQRALPNEDWQ